MGSLDHALSYLTFFSLSSFPRNLAKKNIYNRLSSRVKLNKSQTNFWDSKRRKWLIICKWDRLWIHYHFSSQETNRTQSSSKFQIDWWMNLRIEFRKKKLENIKRNIKRVAWFLTDKNLSILFPKQIIIKQNWIERGNFQTRQAQRGKIRNSLAPK